MNGLVELIRHVWICWPSSLFTWDVLFLIPLPWVSPVLVPVLISFIMITWGFLLLKKVNSSGRII